MSRWLRRAPTAIAAVVVALTAFACSDDDPGGGGTPTTGPAGTGEQQTGVVAEGVPPTGDPVAGGQLTYGLGAETDGWNPTRNAWGPEGVLVALTVYDPLAAFDTDGVAQPFLARSIEPSDDFTDWTITLRPGVTFHNGDPLTAAAVETVLEGHRDSALSAPALAPLEDVEVTGELTAVAHLSSPWVSFPSILTAQLGVVPHPSVITENRNDQPVGTGPFQMVEWLPDSRFVAERNDAYWQEGLPYLDRIEFRPILDDASRKAAFEAGDLDMFSGAAPADVRAFEAQAAEGEAVQFFADRGENEEGFVMMNLDAPPFDDLRVRQALAYATDAETYNTVIDDGALRIARGPFVPENPFFVETDFPGYDPDRARELLAEVTAETGQPVSFTFTNTPDDFSRQQSALLEEMWRAVGFEVDQEFVDQTTYILDALAGDYQANAWRQFGAPDPDADYQWWHSTSSLNFARLEDPAIDEALDRGRQSPDPEDRRAAYATLQERFTALVPYIWLSHVEWGIVAHPWVQGIPSGPLPDGGESMPFVTGTHRLAHLWVDEGHR